MAEQCWICGSVAKTGEHLIKASDLRTEFPKFPVYYHTDTQKNLKIQGPKSKKLKSMARICAYCNNELTQPYDRAWEKLSSFLNLRYPLIQSGNRIKLRKVFPGEIHIQMINVHLYFVKLFGCLIQENNIPINLKPFSNAILNNRDHENIYIAICPKLTGVTGYTDLVISKDQITGRTVFAVWYYEFCKFCVRVMFVEPNQSRKGLSCAWHPLTVNKYIKVGYNA